MVRPISFDKFPKRVLTQLPGMISKAMFPMTGKPDRDAKWKNIWNDELYNLQVWFDGKIKHGK